LIVAGPLKGIIGVGMPVVALPLLSLFIDIKSAVMLLSMPLIFSNVPQSLEGGKTGRCLMQLMPVILGMIPGLFLGVRVLLTLNGNVAEIIAGVVVMGVAGVTLLAPKLQLQSRLVLPTGITFGFFGGILGAIAAMPAGVDRGHCRGRRVAATWFLQLTGLPVPLRLVRQVRRGKRRD
jgi:uncharacterized membrane protein YfcA